MQRKLLVPGRPDLPHCFCDHCISMSEQLIIGSGLCHKKNTPVYVVLGTCCIQAWHTKLPVAPENWQICKCICNLHANRASRRQCLNALCSSGRSHKASCSANLPASRSPNSGPTLQLQISHVVQHVVSPSQFGAG